MLGLLQLEYGVAETAVATNRYSMRRFKTRIERAGKGGSKSKRLSGPAGGSRTTVIRVLLVETARLLGLTFVLQMEFHRMKHNRDPESKPKL